MPDLLRSPSKRCDEYRGEWMYGYIEGHARGYQHGWDDRGGDPLTGKALEQWHQSAAGTTYAGQAELEALRSPGACRQYRIAVRDPMSRNDVRNRADLVRVCLSSWDVP